MKKTIIAMAVGSLVLAGCGGGSGSSTTTDTTSVVTGLVLPNEISAVPTSADGAAGVVISKLASSIKALASGVAVADLPATSDYKKATAKRFIEERTLEQFSIIETIMNALSQTHYADADNVNQGPYKAIVAWEDEQDGRDIKTLEPWVVDSSMIVGPGPDGTNVDINRVLVWIEEIDEGTGQTKYIRAEFKIYQSASIDEDGSYLNYGEWDMNVRFDETGDEYFAATARIDDNGVTVLKVAMEETSDGPGGGQMTWNPRAIMYRSGTEGYGRVSYPDMNCDQNGCTPTTKEAKYAYNDGYLGVQEDNQQVIHKDRNGQTDFTHRYGLYYASANADAGIAAGDDVQKHKRFGFPVRFTDNNGISRHAYYGSWQGRHELWGGGPDGNGVTAGTTVSREDRGSDSSEQYVVSSKFNGTLTKRILVDGELSDIQDIAVETWLNKHWDLRWNQAANGGQGEWRSCAGWIEWDFNTNPPTPTCRAFTAPGQGPGADIGFTTFSDFDMLVGDTSGRKWVNVHRWNQNTQQPEEYMYLAADPTGVNWTGPGFYPSQMGQNGQRTPVANGSKFVPQDGDDMAVDIGGSIYIQYTGDFDGPTTTTGWVQKSLQEFDQQTWTPTFDANADAEFSPELGREYYINSNGANFVVKRKAANDAAADYEVKIELQSAANPVNVATFIPDDPNDVNDIDHFRTPWRPEVTFDFVTDAADPNFMKLVYATDDPNADGDQTGDVYTSGQWGLQGYNANGQPLLIASDGTITAVQVNEYGFPIDPDQRPTEFNWEYSTEGWGTQQFLCSPDCSATANFVILSNPVRLNPLTVANGANVDKTLSLQYDGWMHGLPDLYFELSKNNWTMSQSIADKVINIPAGTLVTDVDGVEYYLKPLEISVFLNVVTGQEILDAGGTPPDLTDANAIDLATEAPTFTEHGMGDIPADTVIKYSEGKAVE